MAGRLLPQTFNGYASKPKRRYGVARSQALGENTDWTLPIEIYCELIAKRCHYCGGSLSRTGSGLDRKDNNRGYHVDNVVPCCWGCNAFKGRRYTFEEMLLFRTALHRIRKARERNEKSSQA